MAHQQDPERPPDPRRYRGMNPTVAILGLGSVFLILALLMIVRGGHDDAKPPELVKPGVTRPG
jgi:hypothetical protein